MTLHGNIMTGASGFCDTLMLTLSLKFWCA
jgi:hypothetical protein